MPRKTSAAITPWGRKEVLKNINYQVGKKEETGGNVKKKISVL